MKNKGLLVLCIVLLLALVAGGYLWYQEHEETVAVKAELAAQVEALTADNEAKAAQVETLTADSEARAAEIETLTADSADKAAQIETLTADNEAKAAQVATLTTENTDKAAQIETLTADNEAKAAEIEALTTDNADKAAQIESLTADNEAKAAEIEALTTENTDKAAQIETLTADNEAKAAQIAANQPQAAAEEDLSDVTEDVYLSTKRWLHQIKAHDFNYTLYEAEAEDKPDEVALDIGATSAGGTAFEYAVSTFTFAENNRMCFRIWNVIEFDPAHLVSVRVACDKLNAGYMYAKFYADESDNTVTMEYDLRLANVPQEGEVMWKSISLLDSILCDAYDILLPYQK